MFLDKINLEIKLKTVLYEVFPFYVQKLYLNYLSNKNNFYQYVKSFLLQF